MRVINFDQGPCRKIRSYLDFYLNSELLIETNHEVLKHLQSCAACSVELETRARLKRLLQRAVQHERAPAALREKIQREIRRSRPDIVPAPSWWRIALVASILLALLMGIWSTFELRHSTSGAAQPAEQARSQQVSEQTVSALDVGLDEHAYCALHWRFSKELPTLDQVAKNMGPDYAELARLVQQKMPKGYKLAEAHHCRHNGREFDHFILKNGPSVLSVIVTGKLAYDAFPAGPAAASQAEGISIYRARDNDQEVAGFETARHLVFVVSGLDKEGNMQIASRLAPSVHDFLARFES